MTQERPTDTSPTHRDDAETSDATPTQTHFVRPDAREPLSVAPHTEA